MSQHRSIVEWMRGGAAFVDNRYSRGHRWIFDGGVAIPASASPSVVPLPCSVEAAVDPEEAFVASLSSCHMLWFLSIAAKRGFVVDSYRDEAVGTMGKDADGRLAITKVVLRPAIATAGARHPTPAEIDAMHDEAHRECFIARSVRTEVRHEPVHERAV